MTAQQRKPRPDRVPFARLEGARILDGNSHASVVPVLVNPHHVTAIEPSGTRTRVRAGGIAYSVPASMDDVRKLLNEAAS